MDVLDRPIFIVAPPQSGSTYLFEALGTSPSLRAVDARQRQIVELAEELRAGARGHDSNRRTEADATPEAIARLRGELRDSLLPDDDQLLPDPPPRLLDAAPRNALRVPFLDAVFPDASFVYLYREPRETIASIAQTWESGRSITYPGLPGWPGPPWSMLLVPGWRELAGRSVAEIAAAQWTISTETLLDDLEALAPERWCVSDFASLRERPQRELARLCEFLGIERPAQVPARSPVGSTTRPTAALMQAHGDKIQSLVKASLGLAERAHDLLATPGTHRPRATASTAPRSLYTPSLARVLSPLGGSLVLTAGRRGRIVTVRRERFGLSCDARAFPGARGLAIGSDRIAIGGRGGILEYRESTELSPLGRPGAATERAGEADVTYLPRVRHYTGDAGLDELAFLGDELWVLASRYDCLATLASDSSLQVRWEAPGFADRASGDRSHLTGVAFAEGEPAYVTALGEGGEAADGREGLAEGGVLLDVREGRAVATGLSLPNSPRLHRERVWFCEAGTGALSALDPARGEVERVAMLPGVTRGLALLGPIAFVGISMPPDREPRLPVAERIERPVAGVWAVSLDDGHTLGFLRFEEEVSEIFAVAHLPRARFPRFSAPGDRESQAGVSLMRDGLGLISRRGGIGEAAAETEGS